MALVALFWLMYLGICSSTDPELNMNVSEAIKFYGYPCEIHDVITEDGYILGLQRIPYGMKNKNPNRPVVFLQHGLSESSFTWISNGPGKSLAFILADNGYDVWLGNSRGNIYSRRHKKYENNTKSFWDFSWDDMVEFDLPSSINYALKESKASKLSYVGHSQGGAIGFARFSRLSELNPKISSFVALAPAVYIGNTKAGIKYLASIAKVIHLYSMTFHNGEYSPSSEHMKKFKQYVCGTETGSVFCGHVLFLMQGYNIGNLDLMRIPIYLSHHPAGTSSKNMLHYAQSYSSNEFQYFDYGMPENMIRYGKTFPPRYNVTANGIPVALFWGGTDKFTTAEDMSRLVKELGNEIKLNKYIPQYNHVDFIWGIDASEVIYSDLINFIKKYQI